jgi:hypothetical protein
MGISGTTHGAECSALQPESEAYDIAKSAMSGHFPVELEEIENCGIHGFSALFKAAVETYETYGGWTKAGNLRCWKLSQHKPGEPYSCERKIITVHEESSTVLVSEYDIPLPVIREASLAMNQVLGDADQVESIDYVSVPCGGAWSIESDGFLLKLKPREPGVRPQFLATKDCSPTPCVWQIEELEPERWVH